MNEYKEKKAAAGAQLYSSRYQEEEIASISMNIEFASCSDEHRGSVTVGSTEIKLEIKEEDTQQNIYVCDYCSFVFTAESQYEGHKQQCESNLLVSIPTKDDTRAAKREKFQCPDCGYKTSSSKFLKKHTCNPNRQTWLKCLQCNYKTVSSTSLQRHNTKEHIEENSRFIFCDCKYGQYISLKNPDIILTDKLHVCKICDKVFLEEKHLEYHMDHHNGTEEPLECDDSGFSANSFRDLNKHTKSKHSNNIIPCDSCNHSSVTTEDLKKIRQLETRYDKKHKLKQSVKNKKV